MSGSSHGSIWKDAVSTGEAAPAEAQGRKDVAFWRDRRKPPCGPSRVKEVGQGKR